jgi:hypothetical protein
MASITMDETRAGKDGKVGRKELLEQLERIVTSDHFRHSKRYPSFLRFIVERTVEENTEVLKERNLGTEVFGRPSDYDTSADPIVRVTAGEVRKRIAQYYQTAGHEHEPRIELPLGSYVPHFHPAGLLPAQETRHDAGLDPAHDAAHETAHETQVPGSSADPASAVLAPPVPAGYESLPVEVPARVPGSRSLWRPRLLWTLCVAVALAAVAGSLFGVSVLRSRPRDRGIDDFWQSVTPASGALIVLGVHSIDSNGKELPHAPEASIIRNEPQTALDAMIASDMVPVSDVIGYSRITDLLTRRAVTYRTKSSTDAELDELRLGPVVLVGGFNNVWTMRLASNLRYRLVPKTATIRTIQDSQHPATVWTFDNLQPAIGNSRDYAIVASYFDPTIEQHVIIAAGIGKNGTTAATEFVTSDRDLKNWLAENRLPANRNVELVLSTEVLDGEPGPPHVIAYTAW